MDLNKGPALQELHGIIEQEWDTFDDSNKHDCIDNIEEAVRK